MTYYIDNVTMCVLCVCMMYVYVCDIYIYLGIEASLVSTFLRIA